MGLFEDFSRFLETRLEEFLRNNPHLEWQALEEQLREQEEGILRLFGDLQRQEKTLQDQILETAQEIQRWHIRIDKAKAAGRMDLAQAAQEREATLLRQGNQLWGQMQGVKERIQKAKELHRQVTQRRQEVREKAAEAQVQATAQKAEQQRWDTAGWNQTYQRNIYGAADPLEAAFQNLETDDELDRMKRNMGR
jgi:uncharacterized protein (TIGR04376 family)